MKQLIITKSITSRDRITQAYFNDIGRDDLISQEEETELAQKIKLGDTKALEKLTKANLRFVVSVAKQYQNQGLPLPDLINEGNLGLIKAAKRFDETRGFKFISYAVWWIRQSILKAIAEQQRIVRLPLNQISAINKLEKARQKLEQFEEREPTNEEIAEQLEISIETINETIGIQRKTMSLDKSIGSLESGEEVTLLDIMKNTETDTDQVLLNKSLKFELNRGLGLLPERERKVIEMFFGVGTFTQDHTLYQIGKALDLTPERVRQLKETGIKRMKRYNFTKTILKQYL